MLIERPPMIYRLLFREAVWRIRPQEKAVYLTFDDGPIPEVTPWVLDTLDCYGAKATFFMVGDNARRNPDLVAEARARGHQIGNHTMHHMQGIKVGKERYLDDVAQADELLHSRLFRPPHGVAAPGQLTALRRMGYKIIMQDLVTRDYYSALPPERIAQNVMDYTRCGSIIVFHDSLKSKANLLRALPMALAWLRAEGYEFRLINPEEV